MSHSLQPAAFPTHPHSPNNQPSTLISLKLTIIDKLKITRTPNSQLSRSVVLAFAL
ncbi:uncharacterized protein BKA55DRAFT_273748 [Fusarium redolens]|uniref:Uncharacterized protein n=1 Tax=Fusarium redolens TaxID=48865 RepID=A0A9P9HP24_FUSRE|nr:uncharacterized protein BKA55DRAFT_273748 [Fusarium redolens]KAH7261055.1 hypothetical protein BKA55DRAFT_273748 [Fusarium redolens]